jgi:hypothetical protein
MKETPPLKRASSYWVWVFHLSPSTNIILKAISGKTKMVNIWTSKRVRKWENSVVTIEILLKFDIKKIKYF